MRDDKEDGAGGVAPSAGRSRTEGAEDESERRLQAEWTAMRRLQEVSTHLVQESDPAALYQRILDVAVSIMRSQFASLQLLHPGGEVLELLSHKGFNAEASVFWQWVRPEAGSTCAESLRTGRRSVAPDVDACPFIAGTRDHEVYRRTGIRAVQTTPLLSRSGRVLGMLSTHWSDRHEPSERDLRLMDILARQAADLIERSNAERQRRLYETIISSTPDLVYVFDLNYRFTFVNEALLQMWGRTLEDSLGKSLLEVGYEPWHAEMHEREIDRVVETRAPIRGEVAFPHAVLGRRIYDYIFVPVFNGVGDVEAVAGTTRDVTDRKRAEESLRAADRAKDDFLAMLGHELRNPLGAASNALHLVQARAGRAPDLERLTSVLARQLSHMSRLVDDLLDVTRVTSGKVRLEQEPLALDAVVSSALEGLQRAIGEKGLKVFYDGDPQVWVLGDALRLEQVAMNLIENAVKYTARGEVHVAVRRNGEGAELTVRDTGTGIAPEMLPRVFDLFSQAGVALDRSQGGLGIGLTIVRRLVELHGGRVTADSPGLGYGSTFTVSLPALAGHDARRKEAPAEPARACRHLRILVVDDNTDAAEALVEILRMWGHTAWSVHDGLAALKEAQEGQPDVALLDIGLPRMDGYEVARRLRDEARLAALKIIAVTGYGQDSDRQKARAARFDNHLVKPVPLDALEQLLAQI